MPKERIMDSKHGELITMLKSKSSKDRRSAAKKIRKLKLTVACKQVEESILLEIESIRSWETQYQMIMALGECKCNDSKNTLYDLTNRINLEPMVRIALGDAITRIEKNTKFLEESIYNKEFDFIEGCLRALALEQITVPLEIMDKAIQILQPFQDRLFWIAAAAPNCNSELLRKQLIEWTSKGSKEMQKAAKLALENKYFNWKIL